MSRSFRLGVGSLLWACACSNPAPVTRTAVFRAPPPPLHVTAQREPLRGYRLSESFVAKAPFRDGAALRVGAIVNGLRVRPDASGLRVAESVAAPPLQAGAPLPEAWGGGVLFWNETALYTADSFLGPLAPLFELGFRPARVSFGPSFVLLRGGDGERLAIDLQTRQRVALAPPLLADIATAGEGRVVALLEGGTCLFSDDAGKSYRPLALPAGTSALNVREDSGQLLVGLSSGQQMRLDSSGASRIEAAPRPAPARPAADSLWPIAEPPLEHALSFGVPIGEEFAGVAVAGSVATVNLRTGELVQVTRALVPSELSCRTLDVNGALLLACNSASNGSLVLSDAFGERPITQAKFAAGVSLHFAEGVLIAEARCDGRVHSGAVCVRSVDGRLHDYDVSTQLASLAHADADAGAGAAAGADAGAGADADPSSKRGAPSIVRWVPKQGGGAVALVGGSAPGLLDAQTGRFVAISPEVPRGVIEAMRGPDAWLGLDWIALKDGTIRGWLGSSGVAIAPDGRLEPSVYEFSRLAGAGAHALAFDRGQRVFQSSDWGRSWVETLAPPGFAARGRAVPTPRCSQVGCLLGPWLRVGWEAEVPAARVHTQRVTEAPPSVTRAALPLLSCKQLAAPTLSEQSPNFEDPSAESAPTLALGMSPLSLARDDDYQSVFPWATVHPSHGTGAALGLRAAMVMRLPTADLPEPVPANWPGYRSLARVAFVSAFEPRGRIQSASLTWGAMSAVARAAGLEAPSFPTDEVKEFPSLPVLGRNPGEADGLLLDLDVPLWVRASGAAVPLAFGADSEDSSSISAVQSGPGTLAVLRADEDGRLDVIEFASGRARRLFSVPGFTPALYPSNPDALAIDARGALSILRTPSGRETASRADPALLIHEDGRVTTLAPWERLFSADAPECQPAPGDVRALLQTSRAWLHFVDAAQPVGDDELDAGMFALLRGNADRLCLEALELAGAPTGRTDLGNGTRLTARFVGTGRGAARIGISSGFEFRQPLACRLSGAR